MKRQARVFGFGHPETGSHSKAKDTAQFKMVFKILTQF